MKLTGRGRERVWGGRLLTTSIALSFLCEGMLALPGSFSVERKDQVSWAATPEEFTIFFKFLPSSWTYHPPRAEARNWGIVLDPTKPLSSSGPRTPAPPKSQKSARLVTSTWAQRGSVLLLQTHSPPRFPVLGWPHHLLSRRTKVPLCFLQRHLILWPQST